MCRNFLYFEKAGYKIDPRKFYNCPTECSIKGYDIKRRDFCNGCDKKKNSDRLLQSTLDEWRAKLGNRSKRFKYDDVLSLLHSIIGLEDSPPENLTVKSSMLLGVYISEKNRRKRIELWDAEKESK